jgi:flagellar biogenesis protein FliO
MAGPTSARGAGLFRLVSVVSVILLMVFFQLWLTTRIKQKTHDRCQPWVLVEIQLNNDKRQRRR